MASEPEPITSEELEKLVKEVLDHPERYPTEAKLLLVLREWQRQGPSYVDEQRVEIIYGEAERVILEEFDEGYPHRRGTEFVLIPRTVPVVVLVEYRTDTVNPPINELTLYVFTKDGWKKVQVY
jgi:hypothetical protein